ncbi:MAG: PEP-CTERM system histidine kinase PrsK [Sphingomonadaceae bacterium]|nr:MAG: PEP-CTERM system histidine kinase PrsK [Sphingomonadaceae bacterium]
MIAHSPFWAFAGILLHLIGAAACAVAAIWLSRQPVTKRSDRRPTIAALMLTGLWAAVVAAYGLTSHPAVAAETARDLAWLLIIYRLFAADGRDQNIRAVRPVMLVLCIVELLHPLLIYLGSYLKVDAVVSAAVWQTITLFHILVAIGSLVLLHNLYGGAARETRDALRWSAAGLAGFWAVELNHYVVAYLAGSPALEFSALRGLVAGMMAVPLALGASNGLAGRVIRASHSVAFKSLSLLLIGGYLLVMFGAAQLLSMIEGDLGPMAQIGFLVAAATVTLLWMPSERMRGWLRVTVLKHLFQHRYDYREEWMRFTETIGRSGGDNASLYERSAKAMADVINSPAALLILPGEDGLLEEVADWKWASDGRPALRLPPKLASALEREEHILELDAIRSGHSSPGFEPPQELLANPSAWVLVPLLHFDRLAGAVLLARPHVPRRLDWEDFDLLKVIARQLASYIAEHENQSALMERAQFDDFNRRIAFVMHDIKNIASQLSLLARNAEKHAENPEFRRDMLVTLRSGSDKLNQLLARLGRYGTGGPAALAPVDLATLARLLIDRFDAIHNVTLTRLDPCTVLADAEGLEQSLVHLVQNAIDASEPDMPITLEIRSDGLSGTIVLADSGSGMDPDFLRHRLFKPFVSSKDGGFGIGAFEARELVRAMGGRMDVQSRPEIGTRFTIILPLAEAARVMKSNSSQEAA